MDNELIPGSLYKHFKGADLVEKNIYLIIAVGVSEEYYKRLNPKYVGSNENLDYDLMVIYLNYFQNKLFAREYQDLVQALDKEKNNIYGQKYRIERLTPEEVKMIFTDEFIEQKEKYISKKYG